MDDRQERGRERAGGIVIAAQGLIPWAVFQMFVRLPRKFCPWPGKPSLGAAVLVPSHSMLHLGSIGKTTIDVDFSFFILLLFFTAYAYSPGQPIQYALIWIPIIFVSVLFHELAHAAMIKLLGFGSSQIVLGGMGGVTMNERRAKPWQDLLISVAGPASNIILMFATLWIARNVPVARTDRMLVELMPRLIVANQWWAIFNMIPVPPLDGGHATREFFRMFLSERTAFIIAIWIAMVVGSGVVVFAILSRSILMALYLGWFVYVAWQQWQYFRQHGIPGD